MAAVEVQVISENGEIIEQPRFRLTAIGTRKEYGDLVNGMTCSIPFDRYLLEVSAPGFTVVRQELRVHQSKVWATVMLLFSEEQTGDYSRLSGVMTPPPKKGEPYWAKLVSAFRPGTMEARVNEDGTFMMTGMDRGMYVLLIRRGLEIVEMRQIEIRRRQETTVEVRLGGR
jgi:hypothetical protein